MTARFTFDDSFVPASLRAANGNFKWRPRRITQAMLAEYEELKLLEDRRRQLRQKLISLLDAGVDIESGPLTAEIKEYEQRTITLAKLQQVGGEQWAAEIKSRVEPTVARRLIVGPYVVYRHE